jgi:epoxyqueuosine reductase
MTADLDPAVVTALARELGFARAAVVPIEPPRRHALFESWLLAGRAGEMAYLASPEHTGPRADLRALLGSAAALIVVALAHDRRAPVPPDRLLRGQIARYARGEDYHLVLRDKLAALADALARALGRPVASRPCVDSAPVHEREWAERGGLGFIAKNTMLIAPGAGSYVLLGELLVDAPLAPTAPAAPPRPRCGSCRACLDACPTGAFVDAYVLDARRCISYLTIEHRGPIPRELRPAIGTWVFGCDVCQEVCPFNAGAGESPEPRLAARSLDHALPDLIALAGKGANQLRQFVRRTALRRIPRELLLRNTAVALGNTGAPEALPALAALLEDREPLVRGHAAWALGRLAAGETPAAGAARAALDTRAAVEDDPAVQDELAAARAAAAAVTGPSGTPGSPRTPPAP